MEEKKQGKFGTIVGTAFVCFLIAAGCAYYAYAKNIIELKDNCKTEEKEEEKQTTPEATECDSSCPVVTEKNSVHVFEHIASDNGYNVYSYLENQGYVSTIVDYNNGLYKVSETGQSSCVIKLYEGAKFANNVLDCAEDESTSGEVYRFDVSVSDVANAYVMQSYRTDGADIALIVFKSGKVNRYDFVDKTSVTKDVFKDVKVKSIDKYYCSKPGEDGCEKEGFTVTLQDGTTKEL